MGQGPAVVLARPHWDLNRARVIPDEPHVGGLSRHRAARDLSRAAGHGQGRTAHMGLVNQGFDLAAPSADPVDLTINHHLRREWSTVAEGARVG
jgi:hypothetical protein